MREETYINRRLGRAPAASREVRSRRRMLIRDFLAGQIDRSLALSGMRMHCNANDGAYSGCCSVGLSSWHFGGAGGNLASFLGDGYYWQPVDGWRLVQVFLGIGNPIDRLGHGMRLGQGVPSGGCWKQVRPAQSRLGRGVFVRVREAVFRSSKVVELQCEWRNRREVAGLVLVALSVLVRWLVP